MSYLETLGFEVAKRQAQKYARGLVNEIKTHITEELEKYMAPLNESLDRLATNISTELQQVRDSLQDTIDGLEADNADLAAQLQAQVDSIASAQAKVDQLNTDLEANDPAPVEPGEPEPGV